MIHHVRDRLHRQPAADRVAQVDDEDRHAVRLPRDVGQRRRAREQDHEVRVQDAGDPHLLAVDDVAVALPHGGRPDLRRVAAGRGLGHAHRLQPQFARRDGRQVAPLLRVRSVAQQRAHVVHLPVARARVAAAPVDLLHDHRRFGEPQPRPAVLGGNHGRQPARARQRGDELVRIAAPVVDFTEVGVGIRAAQRADGLAQFGVAVVLRGHAVGSRRRRLTSPAGTPCCRRRSAGRRRSEARCRRPRPSALRAAARSARRRR